MTGLSINSRGGGCPCEMRTQSRPEHNGTGRGVPTATNAFTHSLQSQLNSRRFVSTLRLGVNGFTASLMPIRGDVFSKWASTMGQEAS
jgi:hypothetical protein